MIIYQAKTGAIELRGDIVHETIWATLDQIASVFGRDKSVISRHFKNIFDDKELDKESVVAKNATTAADSKTYQVEYYNLDAIISVGYRVNSKTATQFRQWATKTLRQHITKGYTLNPKVIKHHYTEFQKAIESVKYLLPTSVPVDNASVLELISAFANTWFSLDAYDTSTLPKTGATKRRVEFTAQRLLHVLASLKKALIAKKEASELFGVEKTPGSITGIIGTVFQSFDGSDLYPTTEEKVAHLLYFMVKNHPFIDGNKRSGAFAFVWYLRHAGILNITRISPEALTALTLLVAESKPADKDRIIGLILILLKKN